MASSAMRSIDAAESPLASYLEDIAGSIDNEVDRREAEEFIRHHQDILEDYGRKAALEVIRRVFTDIAQREHPGISLTAFFVAMGFTSITTETLEALGDNLGVTRAAVSKELLYFRDLLGSRSLGTTKSERSREVYRSIQIESHKNQKQEDTNGIGFTDFYTNN